MQRGRQVTAAQDPVQAELQAMLLDALLCVQVWLIVQPSAMGTPLPDTQQGALGQHTHREEVHL